VIHYQFSLFNKNRHYQFNILSFSSYTNFHSLSTVPSKSQNPGLTAHTVKRDAASSTKSLLRTVNLHGITSQETEIFPSATVRTPKSYEWKFTPSLHCTTLLLCHKYNSHFRLGKNFWVYYRMWTVTSHF